MHRWKNDDHWKDQGAYLSIIALSGVFICEICKLANDFKQYSVI